MSVPGVERWLNGSTQPHPAMRPQILARLAHRATPMPSAPADVHGAFYEGWAACRARVGELRGQAAADGLLPPPYHARPKAADGPSVTPPDLSRTSAEAGVYIEEGDLGPEASPEEMARRVAAARRLLAKVDSPEGLTVVIPQKATPSSSEAEP